MHPVTLLYITLFFGNNSWNVFKGEIARYHFSPDFLIIYPLLHMNSALYLGITLRCHLTRPPESRWKTPCLELFELQHCGAFHCSRASHGQTQLLASARAEAENKKLSGKSWSLWGFFKFRLCTFFFWLWKFPGQGLKPEPQ